MTKLLCFKNILSIGVLLALFVVGLGAYTRLTNAGLGCPDWPGCYGHLVLPSSQQSLERVQKIYPDAPIESVKAWTEMAHRYLAGCLALFIFFLGLRAIGKHAAGSEKGLWAIPCLLMGLVVFQALLGMWTVTLKLLPVVVMAHLLGGIMIFSLMLRYRTTLSKRALTGSRTLKAYLRVAVVIVFIQIALGGWVSANYAGISCVGFPQCNGHWWPNLHLSSGFNLFSPVGANYQGGLMEHELRATIQYIHRLGALVTLLTVMFLAKVLLRNRQKTLRNAAIILIFLILLQVTLGILNVTYYLPLSIAVGHNVVAAILLAVLLSLLGLMSERKEPNAN